MPRLGDIRRMYKPSTLGLLLLACPFLYLSACASSGSTPPAAPPPPGAPATEPAKESAPVVCSLPEPPEGTVYLAGAANAEWQRRFESQRDAGSLLLVKKNGDVIAPLDCKMSGKYQYAPQPRRRLECAADEPTKLKARLPAWLEELGGALPDGTVAAYEAELVGHWQLEGSATVCQSEVDACSEATHVVESIDVGAYASYLAPRDAYTTDTKASVLFALSEGQSSWADKVQSLSREGQLSACEATSPTKSEPMGDCRTPVAVRLRPIAKLRDMVFKGKVTTGALGLHPGTPNLPTYGVSGPEELARLNLVKMCDPGTNNCVTPEFRRAPELPAGTMYASSSREVHCGGSFTVEGEYWVEANTYREPGLKLCAFGANSTDVPYCSDIAGFKQTNLNRKSNWRTDPWPKFKAELKVPASGTFAAAIVLSDPGNFGIYLRGVSFSGR
jgi:hypothetical protein